MLIRNLKLFDRDAEKKAKFQTIIEQEDDLNYQRRVQILLEKFDIKQELVNHLNKHKAQKQGLRSMKGYFKDLQILDNEPSEEEEDNEPIQEIEDKAQKKGE